MAQRFGGRYSPDGTAGKTTSAETGTLRADPGQPMRGRGRRNLLALAILPLLWTAFRQGAVGMALDIAAAAVMAGAIALLTEGMRAEEAFAARKVAKKPALPRKVIAAVAMGFGVVLAALDPAAPALLEPLIYGVIAAVLHLAAFGLDPLRDKGVAGADSFQSERVARAVDEAEAHLEAMGLAVARAGDRALERRVEAFQTTARQMFRSVEEDPRDLTAVRKYLGVYLLGARDATVKFADLYARRADAQARAEYVTLLDDLEQNFAAKTLRLMESDRTDLDIEIAVLRDRLTREGLRATE